MFVEITMLNCTQDSSSPTLPLHQLLQKERKEFHLQVLWKEDRQKMSNAPFQFFCLGPKKPGI